MAAPTNIFAGVTTRLYYDESATPLDIDASDVLAGAAVASNLVDFVTEVGDYNPTLNIHEFGVYGTRNSSYLPTNPNTCLLYTSPSPRDRQKSRMPSSA